MWNKASSSTAGNATPAGPGASASAGGWHPTVIFLLGLIVAEIVILGLVSRHLLSK